MDISCVELLSVSGGLPVPSQIGVHLHGRHVTRADSVREGTQKVRIWEVEDGEVLAVIEDHSSSPWFKAFGRMPCDFHAAVAHFRCPQLEGVSS